MSITNKQITFFTSFVLYRWLFHTKSSELHCKGESRFAGRSAKTGWRDKNGGTSLIWFSWHVWPTNSYSYQWRQPTVWNGTSDRTKAPLRAFKRGWFTSLWNGMPQQSVWSASVPLWDTYSKCEFTLKCISFHINKSDDVRDPSSIFSTGQSI